LPRRLNSIDAISGSRKYAADDDQQDDARDPLPHGRLCRPGVRRNAPGC